MSTSGCFENGYEPLRSDCWWHHTVWGLSPRLAYVAAEGRTRKVDFGYTVVYGHTELDAGQLGQVHQVIANAGGSFLYASQQHAKVVVCDELACVSSYNFLSSDPFQTASGARELGIVIEGANPAAWLYERVLSKTSPVQQ